VRGIRPERPDVRPQLQFASASHTRVLCASCAVRRPLRPHGDRTHALRGVRVRAWCTQTTYLQAIHVFDLTGRKCYGGVWFAAVSLRYRYGTKKKIGREVFACDGNVLFF
jgi:hypothetical protein